MLKKFFSHRVWYPTWVITLMALTLMAGALIDLHEWWSFDRVLENCVEQKISRCDIDGVEIRIEYRDVPDHEHIS